MYAVYYWPFSSAAAPTPPPTTAPKGWYDGWDKKRRIPVEQLREILKSQGSPWADELADTYQVAEKRLASPKSKKHQEVVERVVERVAELAPVVEMDWGPALEYLRAANESSRTTLAIKNFEAALRAMANKLQAEEDDDEEAVLLMLMN